MERTKFLIPTLLAIANSIPMHHFRGLHRPLIAVLSTQLYDSTWRITGRIATLAEKFRFSMESMKPSWPMKPNAVDSSGALHPYYGGCRQLMMEGQN